MIKVENIEVYGWEAAIRGLRNPMDSWSKSDSGWIDFEDWDCGHGIPNGMGSAFVIGENDMDLMRRLFKGGTEHRKYLRMITVTMDITAPLYWWKEYDTYKVGTVANSCSTMHKIHAKEFELDDFSHEHLTGPAQFSLMKTIEFLNFYRELFVNGDELDTACTEPRTRFEVYSMTKKDVWWQMIQLLPSSYNQRRTVQFSYETLYNIIRQREHHKLDEWVQFVERLKELPYVRGIME